MNILIIGGSKFLGYHLTHSLLDHGFNVTLFNRGLTPDDFGDRVDRITGDRRDYRQFENFFYRRTFDAVIDLIGYDLKDVKICERLFRNRIGQYIFISTGQVYLVTENKNLPAREEDFYQKLISCPPGEEIAYEYGIKKREIEYFLLDRNIYRNFPAVSLRCPVIHGARDYTLRLYSYLLRIQDSHPLIIPDNGDVIIRHIYAGDVVNAIFQILSLSKLRGEAFNLAQKEVFHLSEFLQLIGTLLNARVDIRYIPVPELTRNNLTTDISPFSGRWISYLDPTKAESELGFQSTPVNEWIPAVTEYFLKSYQGDVPDNYHHREREIQFLSTLQ
ncbi:MAG: NAD-dependent epimerase/dehydratase family protein [bacterium]|nr:MAG: NAD-dependent epimerase/dehydratase family protein [bacterium]